MERTIVWQFTFAFCALALAWAHAGYPLWLRWHRAKKEDRTAQPALADAGVSVVIAARNEGPRIVQKITGLLSSGSSRLREIIIVCDHCDDDTAQIAAGTGDPRVRVIRHDDGPSGKAGALNAGVAAATADLVFFTDARQRIAPDAIDRLASWFDDPRNGAVSGSLEIEPSVRGAGAALDVYWRLEKFIRSRESDIDSAIGCTGAIYMIRRSLFAPLPFDTILDDVVTPMQIAMQGFRVRFDPHAKAFDPQTLEGAAESRRKIRTLAGNFQMLFRHPRWIFPPASRLWWAVISHKYLRIAAPLFLAGCLVSSWQLRASPLFASALWSQVALWALALAGLALPRLRLRFISIPAGFLFLQISVVRGFFFWLASLAKSHGSWK